MLEIADDASRDYGPDGKLNKENVLRARLRIETRQWMIARLDPRLWAEKRQIDATVATSVAEMSPEQREAVIQRMLERLEIIARPAMLERERQRQLEAERKMIDVTPGAEPAPVAAPGPLPAGAAPYRAARHHRPAPYRALAGQHLRW
jgi:terminase small subunit-like protein